GIQLGPDYPGSVFVDFQRRVLALRDRGILLAAASKNDVASVEQVLNDHSSSVLKREHFAAFEVHYEDKASSLRNIAKSLSIGTDSLVFFDDNPVEREWVSQQLPEVTVIEVPSSPMGYGPALEDCGCFDALVLTREDRQRAELYRQESARSMWRSSSSTVEDFLRGLDMKLTIGAIDAATLPRVAQLLAKTNQFNVTTRRHSPAQIQAMLDAGGVGLWARVEDRFGDSGLVAAALAVPDASIGWRLDTFLMSCRVIGRQVESALLAVLEGLLRKRGGQVLLGEFIPTSKNLPAVEFFAKHGFTAAENGGNRWLRPLDEPRPVPDCFQVSLVNLD
ncbi:MAG: HAD-IIIC family phosphatase, partial [Verrucomicrobiaceae bacterium]